MDGAKPVVSPYLSGGGIWVPSNILLPVVSLQSSSSIMAPFFANQSCDPWTPRGQPCVLGIYVDYAVNVTSRHDIAAALRFAKEKNVRFVIKNTGHE